MKKEKGKKSKASKLADKAAKKARKKDKFLDVGVMNEALLTDPGFYIFDDAVPLLKKNKEGKQKKEVCRTCVHYYKDRFCRKEGPTLHLAIHHRLLNIGLTERQASDRSYFLPEVPASWHCDKWRDK